MTIEHWEPETPQGTPIKEGRRYHWKDLSALHQPRPVTVDHLDAEEGLIIVKDRMNAFYMVVPEELHQRTNNDTNIEGITP